MAPRTPPIISSSPPLLALFVLLGFRLKIRACVVLTHAAWVVASAMARAEAGGGANGGANDEASGGGRAAPMLREL